MNPERGKSKGNNGFSRREAEAHCNRNIEIADFFADNPTAAYTFVRGKMITYGRKAGKNANASA